MENDIINANEIVVLADQIPGKVSFHNAYGVHQQPLLRSKTAEMRSESVEDV